MTRRRYQLVRYADDFIVLCESERRAQRALRATEKLLRALRLELNPAKTQLTTFDRGFDFLGVWFMDDAYSYHVDEKRVIVENLPPDFFHYHPQAYA